MKELELELEINKKYIVTKTSKNGFIKIGEPLTISYNPQMDDFSKESWTLFGMFRVGKSEYKKLHSEQNTVRDFKSKSDLFTFLKGVEVQLDIKWARERIDIMQYEIKKLEEDYKLI